MKLIRLFTSDWQRKIAALIFGFALWYWVDGMIAQEREYALRVVTVTELGPGENGTLQVLVPDGWQLIESAQTSAFPVALRGTVDRLDDFFSTRFIASFDPELDRIIDQATLSQEITLTAEDLTWAQPEDAAVLVQTDDDVPKVILDFHRVDEVQITLGPHLLEFEGEPASGYVVLEDEIDFIPNQVTLQGPTRAVQTMRESIEDAEAAYRRIREGTAQPGDEELVPYNLLSPFTIGSAAREDAVGQVVLDSGVKNQTVIVETPIRIVVPVRFRGLADYRWRPTDDDLRVIPDPEDRWEAPATWTNKPTLRADLVSVPAGMVEQIDKDWLSKHLMLFLPLHTIDDAELVNESTQVEIQWTLVNLDPEDKRKILRGLRITFVDPEARKVTVQRKG